MSKKKWLLLIIVLIGLGYLLISKLSPEWGAGIDNLLGPAVTSFGVGVKTAIETSPVWQQYDIYFAMIFGGIIVGLLVYRGRDMYDGLRGIARIRATEHPVTTWQTTPPVAQPTPIQTAPKVEVAPTPVAQPEVKKETT